VSVGVRVTRIEEDRLIMTYGIFSHRLETLASEGESTIVCFDYGAKRRAAVPDHLRRRIADLEGKGS
jgi:acyl-CoA thioesterase FadM